MSGTRIADALVIFEGMSPTGNATRTIHIPMDKLLEHFDSVGNRFLYDEVWLVPDVCRSPTGIWKGLNRQDQSEAYCYAGVPTGEFAMAHNGPFTDEPCPPGIVFTAFLTPACEVSKWRFCQEDHRRPGFPINYDTRFGEKLWPLD